jgi:hypothetical protein
MGMLCAVASGVVVGPVLRGLQARRTVRDWSRHDPAVDVAAAESRILRNLLGDRGAAALWQSWWPAAHDVPTSLFDGYIAALEEAYGLSAGPPRGFADFVLDQPGDPLTAVRLRNAYVLLRQDAASGVWSQGIWYLVLLPALLAPPLALLISRALPAGSALVTASGPATERSAFEVFMLASGVGALAPRCGPTSEPSCAGDCCSPWSRRPTSSRSSRASARSGTARRATRSCSSSSSCRPARARSCSCGRR